MSYVLPMSLVVSNVLGYIYYFQNANLVALNNWGAVPS